MNHLFTSSECIAAQKEPVLFANWSAPAQVKTLITTRQGGMSEGVYASLNLGDHVGDQPEHVAYNRSLVQKYIPHPVCYLQQTHSTIVVQAQDALGQNCEADASIDRSAQVACAVMSADCLPVLLTDEQGTVVAAAHAGWRGLVNGILENTIKNMAVGPKKIKVFLGPAISVDAFEVGSEVRDMFISQQKEAMQAFHDIGSGKFLADIYQLARLRLNRLGVEQISGGEFCTVLDRDQFFSYRRDGQTGRMASIIWLEQ
ncbi:peptidoglycan editing factor PgeF [Neisseria sp. Ec49-e6-T10]|uniref:peptidoglycan editing factor PgeF n=1 Tax=Neisseria sp. Ec49-e6-T10 TaxID=3140744 RepID=UPI003EBE7277